MPQGTKCCPECDQPMLKKGQARKHADDYRHARGCPLDDQGLWCEDGNKIAIICKVLADGRLESAEEALNRGAAGRRGASLDSSSEPRQTQPLAPPGDSAIKP